MKDRERQLIYDALCETLFYAEDNGGYYQCNYSVEEIRNLADKYKPQYENNEVDCRRPENYFFCKLGGLIPKCSDCLRNYANSPYTAADIDTWMQPGTLGTKQCSDYIGKDESELDREIDNQWKECNPIDEGMGVETANIHIEAFDTIARHFYELGRLKTEEEDK